MSLILDGTNGLSDVDGTAAAPAIRGTDANTGIFFPAADRIGFAEGGVQVGEFDASSNFLFNSGYGSAAVAYGCRAWVDFDGTGTPAIRGSGNVSSITDNTTGSYTVNFTTAMPDVNFAVAGSAGSKDNDGTDNGVVALFNRTTSSVSIFTRNVQSSGGTTDYDAVNVAIFR